MSFYLLKSTYERSSVGDVFINLDKVESVCVGEKKFRDTENIVYVIKVYMQSNEHWCAAFKNVDDAKQVMKELMSGRVNDEQVAEYLPQAA